MSRQACKSPELPLLAAMSGSLTTSLCFQDFATISYSVPGYFESPSPSVNAFMASSITAEKLGQEEILFRVPRPTDAHLPDTVEFLDVAGRSLALVVVPPRQKYAVNAGDGVKVVAGRGMS